MLQVARLAGCQLATYQSPIYGFVSYILVLSESKIQPTLIFGIIFFSACKLQGSAKEL
jgi:hypothetical protein